MNYQYYSIKYTGVINTIILIIHELSTLFNWIYNGAKLHVSQDTWVINTIQLTLDDIHEKSIELYWLFMNYQHYSIDSRWIFNTIVLNIQWSKLHVSQDVWVINTIE